MKKTFVPETPIKNIDIPELFERTKKSPAEDRALYKSIKEEGIFDPVIVIPVGDRFRLVKGSRRIEQARLLGLPKVPYIAYPLPKGEDIDAYSLRLRFILGEKRQDLLPSQRAALIDGLKKSRNYNNGEMAKYLGVDGDSITNYLEVLKYIPKVVTALDEGRLTMLAARVFVGMSPKGQEAIWRLHGKELMEGKNVEETRTRLRAQYPPAKFPHFYRNAKLVEERLKRYSGKRRVKNLPNPNEAEKRKMLVSYTAKEEEIVSLTEEEEELDDKIADAIPVVSAILFNEHIRAKIPPATLAELEEFAKAYVD